MKKFIWDVPTSLSIALSSIVYSQSFEETIEFCNQTNMDTYTYCAISGPIAENLFKINEKTILNNLI